MLLHRYHHPALPGRAHPLGARKRVEEALDIPMAGGEEEFGVHAFRYLIGNEVFQIVQPDLFYYGGMIRTTQVARIAEAGPAPPRFVLCQTGTKHRSGHDCEFH